MFICYSEEFKCRYCLDVFVERQRPLLLHKKYLGSAHSSYNLKYKENIYILVIGLNVSRFNNDSVLLIIAEKLKTVILMCWGEHRKVYLFWFWKHFETVKYGEKYNYFLKFINIARLFFEIKFGIGIINIV